MQQEEHVYLLWLCSACGQREIPCSPEARRCPACAHVRTFVEFDAAALPGSDDTWTDHGHHVIPPEVVARLQTAGPNWFCTNCTADNYGDELACHACNATRGASDAALREALDFRTFQAYQRGDRGATADLVEQYGEYAGMRAAHGQSFAMDDTHVGQLERAQQGRSAFAEEMQEEAHHASRPAWELADLPSAVEALGGDTRMATPDGTLAASEHRSPALGARKKLVIGMVALLVLVAAAAIVASRRPATEVTMVQAEIVAMHWQRRLELQRWTPVEASGWQQELSPRQETPPADGAGEQAGVDILECADEHHHFVDYVCGKQQASCSHLRAEQESYACTRSESTTERYPCTRSKSYTCGQSCSTKRGANGMATRTCAPKTCKRQTRDTCTRTRTRRVPDRCTRTVHKPIHPFDVVDKSCQRSVLAAKCRYRTQRWETVGERVSTGETAAAAWPEPPTDPLGRALKHERYTLTVGCKEGCGAQREIEVDAAAFARWRTGSPVLAVVDHEGGLRPVDGTLLRFSLLKSATLAPRRSP